MSKRINQSARIAALFAVAALAAACGSGSGTSYDGSWTFSLVYSNCASVAEQSIVTQTITNGSFSFSASFMPLGGTCTGSTGSGYTLDGSIDSAGHLTATLSGAAVAGTASYGGNCSDTSNCKATANTYSTLTLTR